MEDDQTQQEPQAEEPEQEPAQPQLIPALAGYPLAAVYDPASGGELRQKGRRPLSPGSPIVVMDSDGGHVTVVDVAGFMWSLPMKDVRAYVAVPWIASVLAGSIEFANRLVAQAQAQAAEAAKAKIIVPEGGVPQEVVAEMREGRQIG